MTYVRIFLSGLAAILIALLSPWFVIAFSDMGQQRATGLTAIAGGSLIFPPLVWVLAASCFALFFTASRLSNKVLRVVLFWIPTITIASLGLGLFSLFAWMLIGKG